MAHVWVSCHIYTWVMAMYECHVIYIHESWHMYEWVLTRVYTDESCHIYTWVMAHSWVSCHIYTWVMANVWVSLDTRRRTSRNTYGRVTTHVWVRNGTRMNASWHTYEGVMKPTHIQYDSPCCYATFSVIFLNTCVTWLIHVWDTWVTYMTDMTHPCWYTTFSVIFSNMSIYLYRLLFNIYLHIYHQTFSVILLNISIHL